MYQRVKRQVHRTVGVSTTLRALNRGTVTEVFVARDADRRVINPILTIAKAQGVKVNWVDCQDALGKACGLPVGTSSVGFLREQQEEDLGDR